MMDLQDSQRAAALLTLWACACRSLCQALLSGSAR
jgi:hypothetical protein